MLKRKFNQCLKMAQHLQQIPTQWRIKKPSKFNSHYFCCISNGIFHQIVIFLHCFIFQYRCGFHSFVCVLLLSASTSTTSSVTRRTALKKNQRYSMGAVPDNSRNSRSSETPMWVHTIFRTFRFTKSNARNPVFKTIAQNPSAHLESIHTHRRRVPLWIVVDAISFHANG